MSGDYQTKSRMQQKLRAIPIPGDLTGSSVLDIGCDHGEFCRIASERGAARVVGVDRGRGIKGVGFVDLAKRNAQQGWPRCEFVAANIGEEWPDLGRFDLVFAFSFYHHVYGLVGNHEVIWRWFRSCVNDGGTLLWEGPWDTKDAIARKRAEPHGNYTKDALWQAASQYFDLEYIGPGLHRPHRWVIRCTARGDYDRGRGLLGVGQGQQGVRGEQSRTRDRACAGLAPVPRDAEPPSAEPERGGPGTGRAGVSERARQSDRSPPLVARQPTPPRPGRATGGARRKGLTVKRTVPRTRVVGAPAPQPEGRGPYTGEPALILGGADCVWDDLRRLESMLGFAWPWTIVIANDLGCVFPRAFHHWVTLHPEKLQKWEAIRKENGLPGGYITWSRQSRLVQQVVRTRGGASGMLGITVARDALRACRGVACGIPMDKRAHFAESVVHPKGRLWTSSDAHWKQWKAEKNSEWLREDGWLKSMSGRTRDYLGEPSPEWLAGLRQEVAA